MGEETKQEQPPAPTPAVDDGNKPAEVIKEDKAEEAPKQEPIPPQPVVLYVDLHCVGCAKKIQRSIMKLRGVEEVVVDMGQNQVMIKGVVEPEAICNLIKKKTKRMVKVLSPLPSPDGEPVPEIVASQVSGLVTVELNVNMHCEACAEQLKKKILKMRGVQTAETEFTTGKVKVTGTMDGDKLVEYVYRRTKKQARIVPQPEPEPEPEPENPPAEEKKQEGAPEESKEGDSPTPPPPAEEEAKKEEVENNPPPPPPLPPTENGENKAMAAMHMPMMMPAFMMEQEAMRRMMYQHYYQPMPMYMIDRTPAPQLFSDENPNACSIS